jgi:hypothetical protein
MPEITSQTYFHLASLKELGYQKIKNLFLNNPTATTAIETESTFSENHQILQQPLHQSLEQRNQQLQINKM